MNCFPIRSWKSSLDKASNIDEVENSLLEGKVADRGARRKMSGKQEDLRALLQQLRDGTLPPASLMQDAT